MKETASFGKDTTKFSQELYKILHKITHTCPTLVFVRKHGYYVVGPIDSLSSSELRFAKL